MATDFTIVNVVTTVQVLPAVLSTTIAPVAAGAVTLINTGLMGPKGQQGDQGLPGTVFEGVFDLDFAYGDATPVHIASILVGKIVKLARLDIYTPFNGSGAQLTIGSLAEPDRYMASTQNDPTTALSYEMSPMRSVDSGDVYLFITPGSGATAGSGHVSVEIQT